MPSWLRTLIWVVAAHLFVVIVILGIAVKQGMAQTRCAPLTVWVKGLQNRFAEIDIGGGRIGPQLVARVFASPDGATFTILAVNPNGLACLVLSGDDWEPGRLPLRVIPEQRS